MKLTVENFNTENHDDFKAATIDWSKGDKLDFLEWCHGKNFFISDVKFDETVAIIACLLSEDKDNKQKIVDYINEKNRK